MAVVCRALKVARSTAYLRSRARQGPFYRRAEDTEVLYQILPTIGKPLGMSPMLGS